MAWYNYMMRCVTHTDSRGIYQGTARDYFICAQTDAEALSLLRSQAGLVMNRQGDEVMRKRMAEPLEKGVRPNVRSCQYARGEYGRGFAVEMLDKRFDGRPDRHPCVELDGNYKCVYNSPEERRAYEEARHLYGTTSISSYTDGLNAFCTEGGRCEGMSDDTRRIFAEGAVRRDRENTAKLMNMRYVDICKQLRTPGKSGADLRFDKMSESMMRTLWVDASLGHEIEIAGRTIFTVPDGNRVFDIIHDQAQYETVTKMNRSQDKPSRRMPDLSSIKDMSKESEEELQ